MSSTKGGTGDIRSDNSMGDSGYRMSNQSIVHDDDEPTATVEQSRKVMTVGTNGEDDTLSTVSTETGPYGTSFPTINPSERKRVRSDDEPTMPGMMASSFKKLSRGPSCEQPDERRTTRGFGTAKKPIRPAVSNHSEGEGEEFTSSGRALIKNPKLHMISKQKLGDEVFKSQDHMPARGWVRRSTRFQVEGTTRTASAPKYAEWESDDEGIRPPENIREGNTERSKKQAACPDWLQVPAKEREATIPKLRTASEVIAEIEARSGPMLPPVVMSRVMITMNFVPQLQALPQNIATHFSKRTGKERKYRGKDAEDVEDDTLEALYDRLPDMDKSLVRDYYFDYNYGGPRTADRRQARALAEQRRWTALQAALRAPWTKNEAALPTRQMQLSFLQLGRHLPAMPEDFAPPITVRPAGYHRREYLIQPGNDVNTGPIRADAGLVTPAPARGWGRMYRDVEAIAIIDAIAFKSFYGAWLVI